MVRVDVAGNEFTELGVRLHTPALKLTEQLRFTVLLNPSCESMEIEVWDPVLPTLKFGKEESHVNWKSGLDVTVSVKEVVRVAGAPEVVARIVTG